MTGALEQRPVNLALATLSLVGYLLIPLFWLAWHEPIAAVGCALVASYLLPVWILSNRYRGRLRSAATNTDSPD